MNKLIATAVALSFVTSAAHAVGNNGPEGNGSTLSDINDYSAPNIVIANASDEITSNYTIVNGVIVYNTVNTDHVNAGSYQNIYNHWGDKTPTGYVIDVGIFDSHKKALSMAKNKGKIDSFKGTKFTKNGKTYNMTKESGRQKYLNTVYWGVSRGSMIKLKSNTYVKTKDEGWQRVGMTDNSGKDVNGYTTNELLALAGYTNESTDAIGAWMWSGPNGKFVNFKTSSKGTIRNLIKKVAKEAYNDGYDDGYSDGYQDGYRDGYHDGKAGIKYSQ